MQLLLRRLMAIVLLVFSLWDAWHFPVLSLPITIGLLLYALLLAVDMRIWLLLLPSAVGLVSFAYWSGRYFWDVFDLFILVTLCGGLWSSVPWWPGRKALRLFWPIIPFFILQLAVTLNGLYPLEFPAPGLWDDYFASTNALREAKGVLWAMLLIPMLMQAQNRDGRAARWLVAGMVLGLSAIVTTILWERNLYTGILNFDHSYRVSGWFFDIHTGGAAIDVALVITFSFVIGLWFWWRSWPVHVVMLLLFVLGAYGLFVTFSRANYPAVALMFATLILGLFTLPGLRHRGGRRHGLLVYLIAGGLLVGVPFLMGGTIYERFKTSAVDLQGRFDHWAAGISLVNPGVERWFGAGKGVFPLRYHLASVADGRPPATLFRIQGEEPFIRLSASDDKGTMYLRQRFRPAPGPLQLALTARTSPGTRERLLIEFCERHILRVRKECAWVGINIQDTQGRWESYHTRVSLGDLGTGSLFDRSPLDISIQHRGIKQGLDISALHLIAPGGRDLLANADFSAGMDRWFMSDGNHLRWHAKNIFVHLYVEGGLMGLGGFLLLTLVALQRAWRVHRQGDPAGIFLATAILAGLAIGMFDSVLDAPRVAVLFLLLLFGACVWRGQAVDVAGRLVALPGWMPGGRVILVSALVVLFAGFSARQILSNRLTFAQSVVHYGTKLGISEATLFGWVNETPPGRENSLAVLVPAESQPRIWRDIDRDSGDPVCGRGDLKWQAACWATSRNETAARQALEGLLKMWDLRPASYGEYGNGWLVAVVYDLLSDAPAMTADLSASLQERLRGILTYYLLLLNSDGPAVWHGRATLAAQAMIIASVLESDTGFAEDLISQAHHHYLELLDMLSIAEAWPEGYNYWVNERGFLIALAGYAYLNAFEAAPASDETRRIFRRVGKWHLHNTRPDVKATQIGDEGPRIDLQEETQRIIDTLYRVTQDPVLRDYSNLLETRFAARGYYRGYRWLRPLLTKGLRRTPMTMEAFTDQPLSDWFGPGTMNLLYTRSDWTEDATYLSYRAGSTLSHHSHYDAGHFTLYKGAPLAVTGATYRGSLRAGHRLDYGVRTVSKNSLLVMRPGEQVQPKGYSRANVADGGQRLTMPIANPLSRLDDWRANLNQGLHLEGGRLLHYRDQPGAFTYISSDLTSAYNTPEHDEGGTGGKVSYVQRDLLYLRRLDRVLIRDKVTATNADYKAKWLLQSMVKPDVVQGILLKGESDNGIITTEQAEFRFSNQRGRLHVKSLLPRARETLAIGGSSYRFYTDVDGDYETLDGEIMGHDSRITTWFEPALWRLEINGLQDQKQQDFLTLLSPSVDTFNEPVAQVVDNLPQHVLGARVDDELILFIEGDQVRNIEIPKIDGVTLVRLFGLPADRKVFDAERAWTVSRAGTLSLTMPSGMASLRW